MKKIIITTVGLLIAFIFTMFIGYINNHSAEVIPTATNDVIIETSVTTSNMTTTDTTSSTTSTTSITTTEKSTTTTMTTTTQEEVVVQTAYVVEPIETYIETTMTTEEIVEEWTEEYYYSDNSYYDNTMTQNYAINELTYYSGPYGCYGSSGRTLINDYSIACNSLPEGTIVHIESDDGSINGDYRVDDTGGMGYNVIDIFYSDYSYVPFPFSRDGRISCTVWVVG